MSFKLFSNPLKTLGVLLSGVFCLLYSGSVAAMEPLELEMVAVYEKNSLWKAQDVESMFAKANTILSQCAIHVVKAKDIPTEHAEIPMGYETAPLSSVFSKESCHFKFSFHLSLLVLDLG